MLYTITAVSPEVEDFAIELQIESDATFADLHNLIRESCGWGRFKPSTFYVCDHRWHRDHTIPEDSFEDDTMDTVELGEYLEDEGQRLQYIFDPDTERGLLLEVSHIAYGKHIDSPVCRRSHGIAPFLDPAAQAALDPAAAIAAFTAASSNGKTTTLPSDMLMAENMEDSDFEPTDDDLFDIEEIDLEGFDFTEE